MQKMVDLSIIVPAYNAEFTINRCIESLVNQSTKSLEIILINDNSTDRTSDIMKDYQIVYPSQIKIFNSNKPSDFSGPGYARNIGIAKASGKYIGFLDSDDWIDSDLCDIVLEQTARENADIAIFGVKNEWNNSISSTIRYQYKKSNTIHHKYALRLLCRSFNNNPFISPMVCQKIYRRDFIIKNNLLFDPDSFYEDDQFTFCCFLYNSKIITVPDVFYHYYQNQSSITHMFSKKYIDSLVQAFLNIKKYLLSHNYYDEFENDYLAYLDKGIASSIEMLSKAEPNILVQKQYILYLFKKIRQNFSLEEWINYLDLQRIYHFFGL